MDIKKIRILAKIMNENGLTELELEENDGKIRLKREERRDDFVGVSNVKKEKEPFVPSAPLKHSEEENKNLVKIKSPIVGTFYRAPSPGAPPYVEVGDRVSPDTVVCIIEAMKVMNEIKAEVSGVVKKILVENAQPVEYNQPLFVIEKD